MSRLLIAAVIAVAGCPAPDPMLIAARVHAPPWTLTASDGSGLVLTRIDARAVVEGPLAFTELHLYFHNPENRVREGTFTISLPTGAAVSRFAMEIAGKMQEAEVVDKSHARRVFEDFLRRKQDPALLERGEGNQFSARVFPIPERGDKHLVLSYSQELRGEPYTLALRGLPPVAQADVSLRAMQREGGPTVHTLRERNWRPDRDFVAPISATTGLAAGTFVVAPVAVDSGARDGSNAPTGLTMLVDTSGSRALGFVDYVTDVRGLVEALREKYGPMLPLRVVAFDQDDEEIFFGSAIHYGDAENRALLARGAAGASNLAQAFDALAANPRFTDDRVVVVTDGVVTAGPDNRALVAAIQRLSVIRLDVVLAGGIRDAQLAASITGAGLEAGDVFDLDRGLDAVAAGLGEHVRTNVPIDVPGAAWVYPTTLPAARAGTTQLVFARMTQPVSSIDVVVGGTARTIELADATPALLERAVARAALDELERALLVAEGETAESLRAEIAMRSIEARVISSQTSMLVLETEQDYERFAIDRTTLADILVVGEHGVEQTTAARIAMTWQPESSEPEPPPLEDVEPGSDESGGTGTVMALDEGTMGNSSSERGDGCCRIRTRDQDPQLARLQAIEEARNAGILGASTLSVSDNFASLSGMPEITNGFDDIAIYGPIDNETHASFGYGRAGFGSASDPIATGRFTLNGGRHGHQTGLVPTVTPGMPNKQGELDRAIIRRYIKRNVDVISRCYERVFVKPTLPGIVMASFFIAPDGTVSSSEGSGLDPRIARCVAEVIKGIRFPKPADGGGVQVHCPFTFSLERPVSRPTIGDDRWVDALVAQSANEVRVRPVVRLPTPAVDEPAGKAPLTGKLAAVMRALRAGNTAAASRMAATWHAKAPGDVLALIALGETLEAKRDTRRAARIYGSIIDLYPARADLRRFAGERLGRLGPPARGLVVDTYRRAVADRPDHLTGHRLLAYALARSGDHAGAFAAILAGIDQPVPAGRFAGADRVLREDASILGAVYVANGGSREHVIVELAKRNAPALATRPSTRFVLYWETDANDVDFHIEDNKGGHASYARKVLPSGGELYADVRTGHGPECFAIDGKPTAGPYSLSLTYFDKGPMGYGMGLLQIQTFDGKALTFHDRPFVIMSHGATLDLGSYR